MLKIPVIFDNKENDPVKYIFRLSSWDIQTHLTAMSELAELLDIAEKLEEVIEFVKSFEKERIQE